MSIPAILQQLQGASPQAPANLQAVKQMMGMVKNAGNPNAVMQMLAQQNPQMREALTIIQQCGGSPEKAFYALAQQKGINPQEILEMLK